MNLADGLDLPLYNMSCKDQTHFINDDMLDRTLCQPEVENKVDEESYRDLIKRSSMTFHAGAALQHS